MRTHLGRGLPLPEWVLRLIARPDFQSAVERTPLLNRFARRDGYDIFHIVQGFVSSQVLMALVELETFDLLANGPLSTDALALRTGSPPERLDVFLQAGAALGLLRKRPSGKYALSRRGAALRGVPGLYDMIRHHRALYQDLRDPARFLREAPETELSAFWPYVLSGEQVGTAQAARYSELMAQSQHLVAEDTLRQVSLKGVRHLMDVGGGSGAFLTAVARGHPKLQLSLFDLPATHAAAESHLTRHNQRDRITLIGGNFKTDKLPQVADTISLIRVLYDHSDETIRTLLGRAYDALPRAGRLIIAEPMSGGDRPDPITDVYFAIYTMAMGTGRTRSAAKITTVLKEIGFVDITAPRPKRSYVTSVVTARKPR